MEESGEEGEEAGGLELQRSGAEEDTGDDEVDLDTTLEIDIGGDDELGSEVSLGEEEDDEQDEQGKDVNECEGEHEDSEVSMEEDEEGKEEEMEALARFLPIRFEGGSDIEDDDDDGGSAAAGLGGDAEEVGDSEIEGSSQEGAEDHRSEQVGINVGKDDSWSEDCVVSTTATTTTAKEVGELQEDSSQEIVSQDI